MYTELTRIGEAEGKTVQRVIGAFFGGQLLIAFIDGTFLVLGIKHEYDGDAAVLRQKFSLDNFGAEQLISSGIMTKEEHEQKAKQFKTERQRRRERMEFRQYKRLKAKFEVSDD